MRDSTQGAAEGARSAFAGARDSAEQATSTAFDAMATARNRAQNAAATAGESLSSAYDAASGTLGRASSAVSDTAVALGRRTHDVRDRALHIGHDAASRARRARQSVAEQAGQTQNAILQLIHEQPVIVGAIGLAIGAVIGASLPRSRQEDELMGETSDALKEQAASGARDQFEHLQEAGGRFVEKVRNETEEQGLTSDSAQDLVRDIGAKVSAVAAAAKEGAENELKSAEEQVEAKMGSHDESDRSKPASPSESARVREPAEPERFSETDPNELPTGTGNPAEPSLKTAERVG